MNESLRSLSRDLADPGLEMTSMLFEAVDRVRLALNHPDLRAVARLSMAAHVLDELAPGRHPPGVPLRPLGAPPADGQDAAAQIAGRLRDHPAPATAVLEQYAREPLRVKNRREAERRPSDVDRLRLPIRRGDRIYERAVDLITLSGIPAARARLTVVWQLLPHDVAARLDGDLPFGTLCGDRLARRARAAYPTGADPAVLSTALLVVDGQLAGYASEEVAAGFCDHVATGHGGSLALPSRLCRSRGSRGPWPGSWSWRGPGGMPSAWSSPSPSSPWCTSRRCGCRRGSATAGAMGPGRSRASCSRGCIAGAGGARRGGSSGGARGSGGPRRCRRSGCGCGPG